MVVLLVLIIGDRGDLCDCGVLGGCRGRGLSPWWWQQRQQRSMILT